MPIQIHNAHLQFSLDAEQGCWDLSGRQLHSPALLRARMALRYRRGLQRLNALRNWDAAQVSDAGTLQTAHGPARQISLSIPAENGLLHCRIDFALPEAHPLLMWRMQVENLSRQPLHLGQMELLNLGFLTIESMAWQSLSQQAYQQRQAPSRGAIHFSQAGSRIREVPELAFFSNGWQSWSYTGVYGMTERPQRTRLGWLARPMWFSSKTPTSARGTFTSEMFGVLGNRSTRQGILIGFLSQKEQFGVAETYLHPLDPALRLWADGDAARLDPGAQAATDWACLTFINLDDPDPMGVYLEAVARENAIAMQAQPPVQAGWCSWYHFYQQVSDDAMRANLSAAAGLRPALPLDMLQIDDGFQSQVGDWFTFSPRFPQGVAPLSADIRQAGFTPGLWLAPFILHPKSKLYAQHPDWLLRNRLGLPVNAGFIWDALTAALDLTHPEALDYACQAVQTAAHAWGFPFLKLDFLYAAALPGRRHDPTRTRAQTLRQGLEALRRAVGPETTLLGCGCPLGSALGLVEVMRIGADVAPHWLPQWNNLSRPFRGEWAMPSARNALQNALTRLPMSRRWWLNDPDCLLLRPDTRLTLDEVQTLASVIALSGGLTLISDHLPDLPPERLRIAQALLPPIGKAARALDWFDQATPSLLHLNLSGPVGDWSLLAVFNWEDRPRSRKLRLHQTLPAQGLGRDFWSGAWLPIRDSEIDLGEIPAHGARLLALRPAQPDQPQYLGSSLHLSQGLEVTTWQAAPGRLSLRLERPGPAEGLVVLSLPQPPQSARLNGQALSWQAAGAAGAYQFAVQFNQSAQIEILW